MPLPVSKRAVYEDLCNLPENVTGEIIDGELHTAPRPSPKHSNVSSGLGGEIVPPYKLGRGGPGGWWILFEPEVLLGEDVLVPDLAGWKKEKLPELPETNWIAVPPDWICEVLSPATIRTDRVKKMPKYAQFEVQHAWLIDPVAGTMEVFRLESNRWLLLNTYAGDDKARAEPFQEIEISLSDLW